MIGFVVIAALGLLILIVLLAPKIKRRIAEKRHASGGEVSQFNCTPAGKVKDANGLSTDDTYDCIEQGK
jgi:hypothetical protein